MSEKWQWLTAHRQWVSGSASVAPSHPQSRLLKWHTAQLCTSVGVRRRGVHMCGGEKRGCAHGGVWRGKEGVLDYITAKHNYEEKKAKF